MRWLTLSLVAAILFMGGALGYYALAPEGLVGWLLVLEGWGLVAGASLVGLLR
jgi:hypothetical protein